MKIAILGAGAWGSALSIALSAQHDVALWTRSAHDAEAIARDRASRYLPARIPDPVHVTCGLSQALAGRDLALVATSTAGLREVAGFIAGIAPRLALVWACKGYEQASHLLPHQVVAETMPHARAAAALSGPSFALEVAHGLPTALVLACTDVGYAKETGAALNGQRLRVYSSGDLVGVEMGGTVKNVIAIAAGICDGLELGRNARAAVITRGLAEIVRLGVAMGGQAETFMGLAGLGDLVLTCTGDLSRNREVGVRLARGEPLAAILAALGHVAEGVHSAPAVLANARDRALEMPITEAVCAVLEARLGPREAVDRLLARHPKAE